LEAIIALLEAPDAREKERLGGAPPAVQPWESPISGRLADFSVDFRVDFPGIQKPDAQGQGLLRGPLNLVVPFAGAMNRLVQRFANNFGFGVPASAQSTVSGYPAGAIRAAGNHRCVPEFRTRQRACMNTVARNRGWKTLKKPNVKLCPQADQLLSKLLQVIGY
jgi:hypothetical protein